MDWIARKLDWRQFMRFTNRLARRPGTAYHSALMSDPELAEQIRRQPRAKNPQLFGWTSEMHLLTDIADILYKTATRDPNASLPRPLTAADRLALVRRQAGMNRAIARFSPQHAHLTPKLTA